MGKTAFLKGINCRTKKFLLSDKVQLCNLADKMKIEGDLERFGYAALLVLFCALLFNGKAQITNNHDKEAVKGHFISASNHLCGFMADDDHTNPVDNEEDEDDDEDGAESLDTKSGQEFIVYTSYRIHQDRLFCDPHNELISPPPKI